MKITATNKVSGRSSFGAITLYSAHKKEGKKIPGV